ncbi:hypothetical protein HELRODRAFT_181813 [Helobdella robusta]|uniref:Uncharacterized protein n=1 Tax=Helobdella robusta TaxID=6412 RepID=T1FHD2_HELRO|nr:hypothetical protein HELRODRAFT_181813 [Helobdella robusta]ESN92037.1 hypothetical protein HELRODRAFT_181813 [Helobdella robusta]
MKIRSGILPRLKQLKLPEEFIVDQNGCDVTLRLFIQWQRMHAWLGLKLPEEFMMEDLSGENLLFIFTGRVSTTISRRTGTSFGGQRRNRNAFNILPLSNGRRMMRGGQWWESARFKWWSHDGGVGRISSLAGRLTLCSSDDILCADQMMVNDERWAVVGVSTFQTVVS